MGNYSKKQIYAIASVLTAIVFNLLFINVSPSDLSHGKGLKELTPEESAKLQKIKIKKVRPNALGLLRINEHRKKKNLPPLSETVIQGPELDTATTSGATTDTSGGGGTLSTIPAQVDNSVLAAFPKIGNQGSQGSCVAWATTYYQMSHEVCLSLNCDNKYSSTKVYSPRWTYNMINSGVDGGSYFSDAFSLTANHGASLLSELPYNASDYRGWDLNAEHWKNAISSRMSTVQSIAINSDTAMSNVKQMLLNGHVLVIGTYITSWQYKTVMANPNSSSNPFVGQSITTYINGTSGGHAMTVVGYDDEIWTDINGNGLVEAAELGAFKIANSWGGAWKNGGYIWASYDAFRATSTVPNFSPSSRIQLTQGGYAYISTYTPYAPKLLGFVTLSHAARSNIRLTFASSSTSSTSPQSYWYPKALNNTGGTYAFNGTTTEVQSSFYFDLSSLASSAITDRIYYLIASDNSSGNPLTVSGFAIVDPLNSNPIDAAADVPSLIDAATKNFSIGQFTVDATAPSIPSGLIASLSTARKGKNTTTTITLSWKASTDNVGVAGYNIYRNGVKIAQTTSLSYKDSKTSAGKSYTYEVTAYDAQGNESQKSIGVSVIR